jgi:hypothetical protein
MANAAHSDLENHQMHQQADAWVLVFPSIRAANSILFLNTLPLLVKMQQATRCRHPDRCSQASSAASLGFQLLASSAGTRGVVRLRPAGTPAWPHPLTFGTCAWGGAAECRCFRPANLPRGT